MTDLIRTIIRKCGGPRLIAEATELSHKPIAIGAVRAWRVAGATIPEVHWDTLMQIAAVRGESLDLDDLYQANQAARAIGAQRAAQAQEAALRQDLSDDLEAVSHGGHPSEPRGVAQGGV